MRCPARRTGCAGFTARELAVVVLGLAILTAIAWRQVSLNPGDRGRVTTCDNTYIALNSEVANELDSVLHGLTTACGTTGGPEAVVACTLQNHNDEDNPRNRNQTAFTAASALTSNATSCQVGLAPLGTNGVRVMQYVQQSSTTPRTFSVVIDDGWGR